MTTAPVHTDLNIAKPAEVDQANELRQRLSQLKKASQQFEAIFMKYMLKTMRDTIPEGGLLDRGLANEFYESLFDDEISLRLAASQQSSLADLIFRQLAGKLNAGSPIEELLDGMNSLKDKQPILPQKTKSLIPIVEKAAGRFDLDSRLIMAVIQQESGGNRYAVSEKGAKGLMQLTDSTADTMGVTDSFDPEQNVMARAKYLKHLVTQFDNELELALAAYNAGPANVLRYGGIPPFAETRNYVRKVLETYSQSSSGSMGET
jgi:soluble lytic murein transglycosylase-like protein